MSLGKEFYQEMIQRRERADKFITTLSKWLLANDINYQWSAIAQHVPITMSQQFFGNGYYLTINPYHKKKDSQKPIIIGKGVCFDTGGYNLKNAACTIENMWYDKNGAVLAMAAAIDLNAPCRVFIVDNMPAILPGSIINEPITKLRVYIKDTDAEGRIGLADLLAQSSKHSKALTLATLTGSASAFSGKNILSLVHTRNKEIQKGIIDGEHKSLFPAPIHPSYDAAVSSKILGADIDNLSLSLKGAGSQLAYSFLSKFFEGELVHVDMAAMACTSDGNALVWGIEEVKFLYKLLEES